MDEAKKLKRLDREIDNILTNGDRDELKRLSDWIEDMLGMGLARLQEIKLSELSKPILIVDGVYRRGVK